MCHLVPSYDLNVHRTCSVLSSKCCAENCVRAGRSGIYSGPCALNTSIHYPRRKKKRFGNIRNIGISGSCGFPDLRKYQEHRISGNPGIQISRFPQMRIPGMPDSLCFLPPGVIQGHAWCFEDCIRGHAWCLKGPSEMVENL